MSHCRHEEFSESESEYESEEEEESESEYESGSESEYESEGYGGGGGGGREVAYYPQSGGVGQRALALAAGYHMAPLNSRFKHKGKKASGYANEKPKLDMAK